MMFFIAFFFKDSAQKSTVRPRHGFCPFTFRMQRRRDDSNFKPPVPYPIQTVEVTSIDAERKYNDNIMIYLNICTVLFFSMR